MSKRLSLAAGILSLAVTSVSFGASFTVDTVSALDPNPSNLAITEVGNTTLAASRLLVTAAKAAGTGGVLDFQQRNQGGTFPNSAGATAVSNGIDFGDGAANPLYVTNGATGDGLVGTPFFSFYRLEGATPPGTGQGNIDSNLNQGSNIISGGYLSRNPATAADVNGINPAYPDLTTTSISGGYLGITNQASPATLVFNNPLSFFGITALPRGATRDTLITVTLSDGSTAPISAATVVGGSAVYFGYTAPAGLTITRAAITNPNGQGQNRYDDLAFVVADVPEPASLAVLGLGAAAMLRRRRA